MMASTRCHPILDCASHTGSEPKKTPKCKECMMGVCFSNAASYEPNF